MTFASQYHMPGAYYENQAPAVHPGVFRPPTSPSAASSAYLTKSTGSIQSESATLASTVKRKRPRNDASREGTPIQDWCDTNFTLDRGNQESNLATPAAGGRGNEMRYVLAGQIDTPNGANPHVENGILDESMYSDVDYRRALGSKRPPGEIEAPIGAQKTLLVNPEHPATDGWSRFALGTIGGVMGKVWEFCKAGAFRGFSAGGGKSYALDNSDSPPEQQNSSSGKGQAWCNEHDIPTLYVSPREPSVPGGFPSQHRVQSPSEYAYKGRATPETTPSRPAVKRRQVTNENDELRHWVMVDSTSRPASRASSRMSTRPVSRNSRPSLATGRRISIPVSRLNATPTLPRRHSSRISHAGPSSVNTHQPASTASTASFAGAKSSRPSSPALESPSRIPVPTQPAGHGLNTFPRHNPAAGRRSAIASPIQANFGASTHRRTHSGASAASPRVLPKEFDVEDIEASPRLDPEAKKLAAKRVLEERDTDARISAFNARLRDMIRQGKEALGTKVEIEGGENGWFDDE